MSLRAYYPLFADLADRRCLVIGGGAVAQRKVTALLRCGARVTVISPSVTRRLATSARQGRVRYLARRFRPKDLSGAWLVYAATDDQRVNALVSRTARRSRIFTNVVDQPSLCSFIAPAIVTRGSLTIAVSTGGASPTLAKRIRSDVARQVGAEYVPMLRLLRSLRQTAKRRMPRYDDRKRYFEALVNGQILTLVRAGKYRQARQKALVLLARSPMKNGA